MKHCAFLLLTWISCLLHADEYGAPSKLAAWKDWVLHEHEHVRCPFLSHQSTYGCVWVNGTSLKASTQRLHFEINGEAFAPRWLSLPGEDQHWPQHVEVSSSPSGPFKPIPVRKGDVFPEVKVDGPFIIRGSIAWSSMPGQLPIPSNSGLINLIINDKPIQNADIDHNGALWLRQHKAKTAEKQRNSTAIQVYRKLNDAIPATLSTNIVLNISGEPREIRAGQLLPEGFAPLHLISQLPARIESNGDLRAQVKPGRWEIQLEARHLTPIEFVSFKASTENWPESELWAFDAKRNLRTVQVLGATAVDPNQTSLPDQWKSLPTYHLEAGQTLELKEIQRGAAALEADELNLSRNLFLDFNGTGMTSVDAIDGELKQSWRLDSTTDVTLGSVSLNDQPQLLTVSPDGTSQGFEVRSSHVGKIKAVGRIENIQSMTASGWDVDASSLQATLHLPPGWSLIASRGVDVVTQSWLTKWNLWNIFLLLITVAAIYRVLGHYVAGLALITLVLVFHRDNAPMYLWLNITAIIALLTVAKGKLATWLTRYQALSFAVLGLSLLPFFVQELRLAVYPQLSDMRYQAVGAQDSARRAVAASSDQMVAESLSRVSGVDIKEEELTVTGIRAAMEDDDAYASAVSSIKKNYDRPAAREKVKQQYDPNAIVQTGPGVPQWKWDTVILRWSGPVSAGEKMHFYFAPPWLAQLGHLVAALLSMALAYFLLLGSSIGAFIRTPFWQRFLSSTAKTSTTAIAVFVCLIGSAIYSPDTMAEAYPSEGLLEEFQDRLITEPDCETECASIQSANIRVEGKFLNVELVVDAQDHIGFGLPAWRSRWLPTSVTVNGKPGTTKLSGKGQLLARLAKGRHTILLKGLITRDQVELNFGEPVHNLSANHDGWQLEGVHNRFVKTGTVSLTRIKKQKKQHDTLLPDPAPNFIEIKRSIVLGLDWEVHTQVNRIAPQQGAMSLNIALLPGEAPTTDVEQNDDGTIKAVFGPQQRQVNWRSTLNKNTAIQLIAANNNDRIEIWKVNASPVWHLQFEGLNPIKQQTGRLHQPLWRPWPGETVTIQAARPEPVSGQSITIENAKLNHRLGKRTSVTDLTLNIRTSRGTVFPLTLPEGATLESITINDVTQPILNTSGRIELPLKPGNELIKLQWKTDDGISTIVRTPTLSLGIPASNIYTTVQLPYDRWVLAMGGPNIGPVVLFWGALFAIVLIALVLSKTHLTPLKTWHWVLLSIGICTTNLFAPVIIALWLLALGVRGKRTPSSSVTIFQLTQVIIVSLTIFALAVLMGAISMGLLSRPEMLVTGNNSSTFRLNWFEDRTLAEYSSAWVLSFPLYVYRIAMLLWALWLAFSLLKWLQWGWAQINVGGMWKSKTKEAIANPGTAPDKDK